NNVNGLLFNPNDRDELKKIIKKITEDHSLIDKLKKGIKPVKSIEEESKELIAEYKKLTEKIQINVSIIIPVFNKLDYTKKCIESLYLNTPGSLNFEVIVVDNGSSDGTKEYLEKQKALHENLNVIINEKNEGFAKANNLAASKAKGSNLVFLNNDTEVQNGWLEALLKISENDNSVGAVGSKLLYPDNTIQHAGVIIIVNPKEENSLAASHVFVNQPSDFPQANELRNYQALTAACLLVKKNVFIQAGGFDENFWNGYEDVDLCFTIGELGYNIVYQPESVVIHHESKSGPERFSKVANNVQLLNKKWSGRIKADFRIDENDQLVPSNSVKIKNYKPEYKANKKVSVIALTYNQLEYTKSFIQSLYQNTSYPFELIIVDNNSSNNTIKFLKELEKTKNNVKLILNNNNLGFPKGVNQGIKKAAGNYILVANNDIVLTKGWLERMIEIAESDPQTGLVGPVSNSVSGMQLDNDAKYSTIEEMHDYAANVRQKNRGKILEFPRVAFLCTLIKKEIIEKIGGLDERFSPGNFEDDDFCLRAQLAGFKNVIAKDVFIHHYGSKSFAAEGLEKYKERLETNQKIFVDKWGATPEEIWLKGKQIKGRNIMFTLDKYEFTENLQRALSLIEEKDYDVALDYLNNSVEQYKNFDHDQSDPELENLLNLAGNISLLNGNLETAQKYFENALNEDKNSSKACTGLGEVLFAAENYEAAKTMYEWGVKNDPGDKAAEEGLARVNKIFNLPENDNSLFNQDGEKVLVENSNVNSQSDEDKLIKEAYEMFNENRFNEALDILSQAEKIFNGHLS
ncbi:MAG: glycosyltransferase, partial [Ignavibacteriaceae bacterium]